MSADWNDRAPRQQRALHVATCERNGWQQPAYLKPFPYSSIGYLPGMSSGSSSDSGAGKLATSSVIAVYIWRVHVSFGTSPDKAATSSGGLSALSAMTTTCIGMPSLLSAALSPCMAYSVAGLHAQVVSLGSTGVNCRLDTSRVRWPGIALSGVSAFSQATTENVTGSAADIDSFCLRRDTHVCLIQWHAKLLQPCVAMYAAPRRRKSIWPHARHLHDIAGLATLLCVSRA